MEISLNCLVTDSEFLICISKCRVGWLIVGGGDTAHGALPGLASPPTRDILKCTHFSVYQISFILIDYFLPVKRLNKKGEMWKG